MYFASIASVVIAQVCEDNCTIHDPFHGVQNLANDGVCDEDYGLCKIGTDCTDCKSALPVWEIAVASAAALFACCTCVLIVYKLIRRRLTNIVQATTVAERKTTTMPEFSIAPVLESKPVTVPKRGKVNGAVTDAISQDPLEISVATATKPSVKQTSRIPQSFPQQTQTKVRATNVLRVS